MGEILGMSIGEIVVGLRNAEHEILVDCSESGTRASVVFGSKVRLIMR